MLASQLGAPLSFIPCEKASDLLAIKEKLGLPDARLEMKECQLCDLPEPGSIAIPAEKAPDAADIEAIVQAVTDAVMASLEGKK